MFYPGGLSFIKQLHLEISSRCNAACPQCPRNFYGYPMNDGYIERDLTLSEIKKIFPIEFVNQLGHLLVNGNFGDIVMNSDGIDILKYFRQHNSNMQVDVITNGGARDQKFWQGLAKLGCRVTFCLEGTDNQTHAMYRQNTLYEVVLRNAQTFINAGGVAVWKMIQFEHNQHQIESAKKLSEELGFHLFELIDHQRDVGPVYNSSGTLVHMMKPDTWQSFQRPADIDNPVVLRKLINHSINPISFNEKLKINCRVIDARSIYVSSTGHVYPCCWLGMAPETYKRSMTEANDQLKPLIKENDALHHGLEHCIKWFDQVKQSWNKNSIADGQLIHCNYNCGVN
jgi:MoaA/NifB/PqqE/SkfB family radical SAM enzyme